MNSRQLNRDYARYCGGVASFDSLLGSIRSYALRVCRGDEDRASMAVMKVWKNFHKFDSQQASFAGFVAFLSFRSRPHQSETSKRTTAVDSEALAAFTPTQFEDSPLVAILDSPDAPERELIALALRDCLTLPEAGRELGYRPAQIEAKVKKIRRWAKKVSASVRNV